MDTLDRRQCAPAIKFSTGKYSKNLSHTAVLIQRFCSTVYNLFLKGTTRWDFSACLQVWNRPQVLPLSRIITANCILPSRAIASYAHSPKQGLVDSRRKLTLEYKEIRVEILKHHRDARILIQANNNGGQTEVSAQELHGFEGIRCLKGEY